MTPLRVLVAFAAVAATTVPAGAAPPRALLPNLVPLPTTRVELGCDTTEQLDGPTPPRRCLRFETHAANKGAGPLELHDRADEIAGERRVTQRVYYSDGTYRDAAAGTYVFHPQHAHFHYEAFAVPALWRSDARGRRLGTAPVRRGAKAGFCLMDTYAHSKKPAEPRYDGLTACYPNDASATGGVSQVSGVSPGWVDLYEIGTAHQYVEISGVPNGYYLLQVTLDPAGRIRETAKGDNTVWQRVRLCGDDVDLVGKTKRCG